MNKGKINITHNKDLIQDLSKMMSIDKVSKLESQLADDLAKSIDKEIVWELFREDREAKEKMKKREEIIDGLLNIKKIDTEVTEEMLEEMKNNQSIDIVKEMEDTLLEELHKAEIKAKVKERDEKIDELLDEEESE